MSLDFSQTIIKVFLNSSILLKLFCKFWNLLRYVTIFLIFVEYSGAYYNATVYSGILECFGMLSFILEI